MRCPSCDTENPERARFCLDCGARLALACLQCGIELPPQAKFCFACGTPVGAPPPDAMRERGTAVLTAALQRLAPKEFVERLVATRGQVGKERRVVTILFSDVIGSTAVAENLDPEDWMEIMEGAFDVLIEPIYRHEGTLARLMGDAILAFFGAPIAHEDDPERAVRAALEIVKGAKAYAARLEREHGISGFNVRVGINTGLVVVGEVGSDLRVEYTAMGDAVNLAARMEQNAPVGGILISHDTYRYVRGVFDVQPLEPIQVKGRREPIQVYVVHRAKPRAFRRSMRGVEGVETRMIGREGELEQLQNALYTAMEGGERQMVTITGEAGVGKSRLLHEFEKWGDLLPEPTCTFKGRASQEMQSIPYGLIRDLFANRFGIQDSDPASMVRKKMEQGISEALGEGDGMQARAQIRAHFIGQLLGFDFSDSLYLQDIMDDARQLRDRALIYLGEYFEAMAGRLPTSILLEDLHWADDSSLDALNRLALTTPEQRLLIVCSARPSLFERRARWGEGQTFHTRVELCPLLEQDSRRLVEEILQRAEQVPEALCQLVVGKAEGNPFYVEELIKMLIEDGVIVKEEERWRVEPGRLTHVPVPPTLTGILQARLDRLPLEERTTMQRASVVGRRFWDRAVVRISESADEWTAEEDVLDALSALGDREMVFRRETSAFAETREFDFKHAMLREVTYESVLRRVRRVYHALVAEWLIEQSGERAVEYTGLIADHLEAAGQAEQAVTYLRRAGEQAAGRFANAEAVAYFGRALDLTSGEAPAERYALLLAREAVYDLLGQREAQRQDLAALKELAEALADDGQPAGGRQAEVALRQAHHATATDDYPATVAAAQEAIRLARAAQDVRSEAKGHWQWGVALHLQGDYEAARTQCEQGLHLAQMASLPRLEADCLSSLAAVSNRQGDYAKAAVYFHQALDMYRQVGDRRSESSVLYSLGGHEYSRGNPAEASTHLEQAYALTAEIGDRLGQARSLNNLGNCAAALGDLGEARVCYERALRIYQEVGSRRGEGIALNNLSYLLWELGDYEGAGDGLEQALQVCGEIGDRGGEGVVLANLSFLSHLWGEDETTLDYGQRALLIAQELGDRPTRADIWTSMGFAHTRLGHLTAAEDFLQRSLALRRELELDHVAMDTLAGLARLYLARDDLAQAQAQVEEILSYLERAGDTLDGAAEPLKIYLTCYRVLRANQDPRAEAILTTAHRLLQERAAKISDEELRRSFLENVATHREVLSEFANSE